MRTKGATSNVYVTLGQLNKLFNENALIPVARRFADQNHLIGKAIAATTENLAMAGNQPAIEEKVSITEIVEVEPTVEEEMGADIALEQKEMEAQDKASAS